MSDDDRLLAALLMFTMRVTGESIDETINKFEVAGLVDHTYVKSAKKDDRGNALIDIEYRLTPMALRLLEGIK